MSELNFGLLTPPGSQSIGNAFVTGMDQGQEARARDLQMQQSVRQGEVTQMQLKKIKQEEADMEKIRSVIVAHGGPPDLNAAADAMIGTGNPMHIEAGQKIKLSLRNIANADAYRNEYGGAPTNALTPAPAQGSTPTPMAPAPRVVNTLAPTTVNSLVANPSASVEDKIKSLERQYHRIGNNPELQSEKALVLEQIKDAQRQLREVSALPPEVRLMQSLGIPTTQAGFSQLEALKQNPSEFERLLTNLKLPATEERALRLQFATKLATHAPGTRVEVKLPAVEGEFSKTFAKNAAEEDIKLLGSARNAPKVADTANRVTELLNKPDIFVGPSATIKLNIARALNVLGADETESMRNTEKLIAASGQGTLDAIKDANLGTGQGFTEKDLTFLRGIAGGSIDLTAENLRTMSRLQYRAAELSVKKWQARRATMPESATKGTGLNNETYDLPPRTDGPTPKAIAYLKAHPNTKSAFDERYGDGEAAHTLRMGK